MAWWTTLLRIIAQMLYIIPTDIDFLCGKALSASRYCSMVDGGYGYVSEELVGKALCHTLTRLT